MDIIPVVLLAVFGLCAGSFAGASVWRLRAKQLAEDKAEGEKVDDREYDTLLPLTKETITTDRSRCLHCGHTLAWYDLLPLVSWISTRGRCRYCHQFIGWFEPLMEVGTAVLFILSFVFWPFGLQEWLQITVFALWLIIVVLLVILFAYDLKWFLLPNKVVFPLISVSLFIAIAQIYTSSDWIGSLISVFGAIFILSGLYLVLWILSKGEWIGFGDVKLGLALALILADWKLAFLCLFVSNLVGLIVVLPGMVMGKVARKTRVPFGPLLIVGGVIVFLFGPRIIEWYMHLTGYLIF